MAEFLHYNSVQIVEACTSGTGNQGRDQNTIEKLYTNYHNVPVRANKMEYDDTKQSDTYERSGSYLVTR